jgi:hypothetical protein
MRSESDAGVNIFRVRLFVLFLARNSLIGLAVWAMIYGVVVLAARAMWDMAPLPLLWGIASLPLVLGIAALAAMRTLPTPAATRALLDRHGRAGGLLMVRDEADPRDWPSQSVRGPNLRWKAGRLSLLCSIGLFFLLLAFLVPASFARMGTPHLDVRREAERLEEQLAVLKEEQIIDEQRAEELKEKLNQLRKDALARDPVKTLEALDFLHDTTQKLAQQAAEKTLKEIEDLAKAEALNDALDKNASKLDSSQLGEALGQLDNLLQKAQAENDLLSEGLDPDILDALKQGKPLTKEQMKKLGEALKDLKGDKAAQIAKLAKARLIDPDTLSKCDKAGECDGEGLAAYLRENAGNLADLLMDNDDEGNGGVNEGGGKTRLKFGDETDEQGAKFQDEELPPSELQKLRDSELQRLTKGDPSNQKKGQGTVTGGALGGAQAGGGASTNQPILPRHRGAVERFFERKAVPKKE